MEGADTIGTMQEILQRLVLSLNAECAAIMEYSHETNNLICIADYNLPEKWRLLVNEPDESSMNGTVYSSGAPIIKNNLLLQLAEHDVKSVLIVPIENDGEIKGTIEILNKKSGLFDAEDRSIAAQFAIKISDMM